MSPRIATAVACLLAASPAAGFAPPSSASTSSSTTTSMRMSAAQHASEDMYPQLLDKASLCAHSDACSIELAESYLREIVHVQSGCAAGTMSGNAVCEDVVGVSEVVADLRKKIGEGARREVGTFWDQRHEELVTLAESSLADGSAVAPLTAPIKPAYLALAALYTVLVVTLLHPATMDANANGVVPLTAQEAWWAVRDGYVGDFASHLFRNGGLLVGDAASPAAGALAPQELAWAIRDGYPADALFGDRAGGVESVPFAPREVWWAVRDGYAADLVGHWFRNGGLSA